MQVNNKDDLMWAIDEIIEKAVEDALYEQAAALETAEADVKDLMDENAELNSKIKELWVGVK